MGPETLSLRVTSNAVRPIFQLAMDGRGARDDAVMATSDVDHSDDVDVTSYLERRLVAMVTSASDRRLDRGFDGEARDWKDKVKLTVPFKDV